MWSGAPASSPGVPTNAATWTAEPTPGMLIFFDWATRDGVPDHVGIVEKVENGMVYTVEGNSRDMRRQKQYALGSSVILGYGMAASGT